MPYRNVLVGTDGSPTADLAVRHAAQLAKACGARLTVATAYLPDPATARIADEAPEEIRWRITDSAAAEGRAEGAVEIAKGVGVGDVRVRVGRGDPADVLVELADDTGADVIVVGSKGMSSPARFVLGSVPNKVSHHAPCDLVIVRTSA